MTAAPDQIKQVTVALGARTYPIDIGPGLLGEAGMRLAPYAANQRVFVVTDDTVARLHLPALEAALATADLAAHTHILPAGEASKSMQALETLLDWLLDAGAGRDDALVAFGGGVVGDLTGLAAALMKRGMSFVQIPTTLLAQVDSSVGGKTAINTKHGKNLVGAFYQPKCVLADTDILATLPLRQIRAGYAEILKYGLIDAPGFFSWLETNGARVLALEPQAIVYAVAQSCDAKARIVAQDETEGGVRALLNLGHTFAHALEAANGFGPELLHGEAVGTGMALALAYSARLGLMPDEAAGHAVEIIAQSGLETRLDALPGGPYRPAELTEHMRQDKKARGGQVPLILARGLGEAFIYPGADLEDVRAFLEDQIQNAGARSAS